MKRILIATVAAATMATSAFAYTDASATMVASVDEILDANGYGEIDVESLSDAQIANLYLIGTSTMDDADKVKEIRAVIPEQTDKSEDGAVLNMDVNVDTGIPANSMMDSVRTTLESGNYGVEVESLTDAQIAGIYLAATSTDDESDLDQKIKSIIE